MEYQLTVSSNVFAKLYASDFSDDTYHLIIKIYCCDIVRVLKEFDYIQVDFFEYSECGTMMRDSSLIIREA
jgi:hypothetical protein